MSVYVAALLIDSIIHGINMIPSSAELLASAEWESVPQPAYKSFN